MKQPITHIILLAVLAVLLSACTAGRKGSSSDRKDKKTETVGVSKEFQAQFFKAQERKAVGDMSGAYKGFARCAEMEPNESVSFFEMARIDHTMERQDAALAAITRAIELSPDNYWYHRNHAKFLLDYGMFTEAQKELEWLIEDHPDELDAYYDLAATFLYREDGKNAIKAYERLEERIGIDPDLSMQKQRIFMLMGETDNALKEADRLIEAFPEPDFYGQKAGILMEVGRFSEAEGVLVKLTELDRTNGQAHMMLSRIYARQGKEDESWSALRRAFLGADVSIDEKIGVLLRFFNASEFDKEARERAFILLERLEKAHPSDPKMHSMYGDYLLREGEFEAARDRFAAAVDLDSGRQLIWLQLCELNAQLGDWDLLVEHAREARNLFPSQPAFYLMLAIGQLRADDTQGAIDNLTIGKSYVIDDNQLLSNFWSTLGEAHFEAGQWKKSDEAFEKALSFSPEDPFIMNNYSYFLAVRGRKLDRAEELSLKSNQLLPRSASFQDTYGWVLFRKGNYADALEWIGKAMTNGANDGVVLEHYGDVLFHLNRIDEAVDYWQRAASAGGASELIEKKVADRTYYDDLKP